MKTYRIKEHIPVGVVLLPKVYQSFAEAERAFEEMGGLKSIPRRQIVRATGEDIHVYLKTTK